MKYIFSLTRNIKLSLPRNLKKALLCAMFALSLTATIFKTSGMFTGWSDSVADFTVAGLSAEDMDWIFNAGTGVYSHYTVAVGSNSTLKDNVNLLIGGGEVTVTGGGTYEIWGFTMSSTDNQTDMLVDTNTTLVIKETAMSNYGAQGSFMMGNWGQTNILTVKGTLDSHAGISMRDGTSHTINVEGGGELILRKGLAATGNGGGKSININVASTGTLTLFNKDSSGAAGTVFAATANMASGSTLQAGETGVTTVSDTINFASNGSYNFAVAEGNTLVYEQDLSVAGVALVGDGALTVNKLTLNPVTRSGGEISITSNDGGTVTIQNADGQTASLTAQSITGVSLTNVTITGAGEGTTISNSTFENATLSNVIIDDTVTLAGNTSISNLKLTSLTVAALGREDFTTTEGSEFSALTFAISGLDVMSIEGSLTLNLGDLGADFMAAFEAGEVIVFNLTDITAAEFNTEYYNVTLNIDGIDPQQVLGKVDTSGMVQLYIPEPSTATLSLLALAGLLGRRRRKTA